MEPPQTLHGTTRAPHASGAAATPLEARDSVDSATDSTPPTSGVAANKSEVAECTVPVLEISMIKSEAMDTLEETIPTSKTFTIKSEINEATESATDDNFLDVKLFSIKSEVNEPMEIAIEDIISTSIEIKSEVDESMMATDMRGNNEFREGTLMGIPSSSLLSSMLGKNNTRLDFFNAFVNRSKTTRRRPKYLDSNERLEVLLSFVGDEYRNIIIANKRKTMQIIGNFISSCEKKYQACGRVSQRFYNQHKDWLDKPFIDDFKKVLFVNNPNDQECSPGQSGERKKTQSRKEEKLINMLQTDDASSHNEVTSQCLDIEVDNTEDISVNMENQDSTPQPYTPEEALALIMDINLSVDSYDCLRENLECRGIQIYPPYHQIMEVKKSCYPEEPVTTTETETYASLQSIVDYTFQRIIKCNEEVLDTYCNQNKIRKLECKFELVWGFDGNTGQSPYEQELAGNELLVEEFVSVTSLVPLRLAAGGAALWVNPSPTSYRLCRPIKIQYTKKSLELELTEKTNMENQINNLVSSKACTKNANLVTSVTTVRFLIIDEVQNINSSQLKCSFCELNANKSEFGLSESQEPTGPLNGISPLHIWIRVLEFLLHLGYKNDPKVQAWKVRKGSSEAQIVESRKKSIQEEIKKKLKLLVDVEKPGAGATNDSHSARLALNQYNRLAFAEILGLEPWLLDDLHTILVAISCGLAVNATKFGDFCKVLAAKYVAVYGWHPMPVNIHKILFHGKDIILKSIFPVGLLPEQAAKIRNNYWINEREYLNDEVFDRKSMMLDIFNSALESSDPVISSIRFKNRQRSSNIFRFPQPVLDLMEPTEVTSFELDAEDEVNEDDPDWQPARFTEYSNNDEYRDTLILTRQIDIFDEPEEPK